MELIKELEELGLDDNEIKVYQSCLRLGDSKVHDVSKESQLIRTTTYGVLKSLIEKGIVSSINKEGVNFFQAVNPEQLIYILDHKKEKIQGIIPKLKEIANTSSPFPKVRFFEGESGVKAIFDDLLKQKNAEVKHIGIVKEWFELARVAAIIFYRKKKEQGVKTRSIVPDLKKQREACKNKLVKNADFRFFPGLEMKGSMFISPTNVAFVSNQGGNIRGFEIEDAEYVKLQNFLFEELWEKGKK